MVFLRNEIKVIGKNSRAKDYAKDSNNLDSSLQSRFERPGEITDLEAAIVAKRSAVDLTPDDHPDKPLWSNNLGCSFQLPFERLGDVSDLQTSIYLFRIATRLPLGSPHDKLTLLGNGVA